jgi:hypothetical protein
LGAGDKFVAAGEDGAEGFGFWMGEDVIRYVVVVLGMCS